MEPVSGGLVLLRHHRRSRGTYWSSFSPPRIGNITAVVKVAGSAIGTVIINNGQTFPANSVDGKELPAIQPSQPITLDITGVGLTYPGERLVATIRM